MDYSSSPDPLNDSSTYHSPVKQPVKTRRVSKVRHSFPLDGSSPTKQTFELDVGNRLSPQKIRVTVEAGSSDKENGYTHYVDARQESPSPVRRQARRRETTKTTTVPVKGLSDSEDETAATPKPRRGRPRKSVGGTPVPAKNRARASTPTQKTKGKRKSIGSLVDGDDEDDSNFRLGQGVEVNRGKGRSRSRSTKGAPKSTPKSGYVSDAASTTSRRGRRKTLVPDEVVVLEDENERDNVEGDELDFVGAPSSFEDNFADLPLENSTISPVSPAVGTGLGREDEVARRTNRSSPRATAVTSSPTRGHRILPSPPLSQGESLIGDSQKDTEPGGTDHLLIENPEVVEIEEEAGGYEDYDTIFESEEFSMISVESLREYLSSPMNQIPEVEPEENEDLVQEADTADKDNPCSNAPAEQELPKLSPVSRAHKAQNSQLLSVRNSFMDESFSSLPPEVLKAATPGGKPIAAKLMAAHSRLEDSFSSLVPEILEAATPGRNLATQATLLPQRNLEAYEDSFSAIPAEILEAATPALIPQNSINSESTEQNIRTMSRVPSSVHQSGQSSTSTRLPTPEETPSPEESGEEDPAKVSVVAGNSVGQDLGNESSILSQMRSSPPSLAPRRYTYSAHLRQRRQLLAAEKETPSIIFSSPTLPPPFKPVIGQSLLNLAADQQSRPKLSPTVRAGRLLQDLVVPSQSPRSRAQSLGSPFKSPISERHSSSSAAMEPFISPTHGRRPKPVPKLGKVADTPPQGSWNTSTVRRYDPFGKGSRTQQLSPSPEDGQTHAHGLTRSGCLPDLRLKSVALEDNGDAMSWQAEEEVCMNDPTTSMVNHINSSNQSQASEAETRNLPSNHLDDEWDRRMTAEREAVKRQAATANAGQVILIDSDDEDAEKADGEQFDLLLETLNSSSPAAPQNQQSQEQQGENQSEKPKRSKVPSPWRQNGNRLVYNDEKSQLPSARVNKRVSLAKELAREDIDSDFESDISEFIIPQKANFKPRPREAVQRDLSALLASSPNKKPLPVLRRNYENRLNDKEHDMSTVRRLEDVVDESSVQAFDTIPQKLCFQPRPRAVSTPATSPLNPISTSGMPDVFGPSTTKSGLAMPQSMQVKPLSVARSKTNMPIWPVQHLRTASEQLSSSILSSDANSSTLSDPGKENQPLVQNVKLQAPVSNQSCQLPAYTSPTKSCLRSPLKTPAPASPTKNVAFVPSSSPLPVSPTILSSNRWTEGHWVLLRTILAAWTPGNSSLEGDKRRRKSTRVISSLLGKSVSSDGERLTMEQWHLEVVDEFREQVPGWQEAVVAKKVFALIVGGRKRANGAVGTSGRTRD